jgi:hypothetical protein
MAPNRQWCHTPEKGTHWYEGPKSSLRAIPVRSENPGLFDGYEPWADVIVTYSQDTYDADPGLLMTLPKAPPGKPVLPLGPGRQ